MLLPWSVFPCSPCSPCMHCMHACMVHGLVISQSCLIYSSSFGFPLPACTHACMLGSSLLLPPPSSSSSSSSLLSIPQNKKSYRRHRYRVATVAWHRIMKIFVFRFYETFAVPVLEYVHVYLYWYSGAITIVWIDANQWNP